MTAARCLSFSSPKDPGENEALPWLVVHDEVPILSTPSPRVSRSLSAALAVCDGQQQQHAISSFLDSVSGCRVNVACVILSSSAVTAPQTIWKYGPGAGVMTPHWLPPCFLVVCSCRGNARLRHSASVQGVTWSLCPARVQPAVSQSANHSARRAAPAQSGATRC